MATQIKLRRDTYQNWYDSNPVLGLAEPGFDTTNKKLKIGDGTTLWRDLPYFDDQQTDLTTVAQNIIPDADNTRDIGSPDRRWKHGYFASGSLYVGDLKLSNNAGQLVVQQVTDAGLISEAPVPNTPGTVTTDRVVNGTFNIALNATGDFIPSTDILQDLGSATNRFRHVYVGPGSVYIGNNVITESATGGLVLPGLTRATGYYAEEVDDEDDWGSNPTITGTVTVIDATRYQILAGQNPSANYNPATYTVEKDGNRIDEINVSNGGSGWTKAEADYARNNNMYATNVSGAIDNFNAGDWVQIPFRVEVKAEDTEYEDIFGGSADLGSFTIDSNVLSVNSGTDIYIETSETDGDGESRLILKPQDDDGGDNPTRIEGSYGIGIWANKTDSNNIRKWLFGTNGNLKLPVGGDIVDSNGNSVLGGGSGIGDITVDVTSGNTSLTIADKDFNIVTTRTDSENDADIHLTAADDIWIEAEGDNAYLSAKNDVRIGTGWVDGVADKTWTFDDTGAITFPDDTVQTTAYTGGGSNSYTPEDTDHWNEPTVNTVQAALDELAARVTALQNYEIDGGNAYTPPEGELLIDGNGA